MGRIFKNMIVFSKDNPNCRINSTTNEIISIFNKHKVPVIEHKEMEDYNDVMEKPQVIIGFVTSAYAGNDNDLIYGDIVMFEDNIEPDEFSNYVFTYTKIDKINKCVNVDKIDSIYYSIKRRKN